MAQLKEIVDIVLEQQKLKLAPSTFLVRKNYLNKLVKHAEAIGITEPCQELYDSYVSRATTPALRFQLHHACRLVDKEANTKALTPQGTLYNKPSLKPFINEDTAFITQFPIEDGTTDTALVIKQAVAGMEHLQQSDSTKGQYANIWRAFYDYLYSKGNTLFTRQACKDFLDRMDNRYKCGNIRKWKKRQSIRAITVLIEIADKGLFEWSGAFTKRDSISIEDESIDALRLQYLESLRSLNLSKNYTELNDYAFRRLISNLGVANTLELYEVQPHQIQSALAKLSKRLNPNSRSTIYPIIRRIISYLYAIGAIQRDFSGMVMTPAYQQSHLRPYLDSTNEQKLNEALKTESFKTKAVISLALCSGLRESDILNLRFSQIDWQNDKIILEQQKSGVKLVLPLIEDVGNAIMDYIISERPPQAKDCEYIFVRSIAPYTKMNSLYNLTYRLFKRAGIKSTNIDRAGMHVLRHTLAYKLLLNKVPHQIITDTLGHVSKESDKPYISMDEQMLRECPLDLSVIGQKYWNEGVIDG